MADSVNLEQLEAEAEALRQNYLAARAGQVPRSEHLPTAQYLHQRLLAAALAYAEAANRLVEAHRLVVL